MNGFLTAGSRVGWTVVLLATLAFVGVFSVDRAEAELDAPSASDRQITRVVVYFMKQEHVSKHPMDDEISQRAFDGFLESLDGWKVYFYQSDIDKFAVNRDQLDNMALKGDISFGYEVFKVFLDRIDERVAMIDEILDAPLDFTIDEEVVTDREGVSYPKTPAEAKERWRKRIKYELLLLKSGKDKLEGEEALEKVRRRHHYFAKRMRQTDSDELLEMYLTSLTTAFDPHTTYMSPRTKENFDIVMRLELEGIGAELSGEDGYTIVRKVVPGGAAARDARLKIDDKIVGVGQGEDGEIVNTVEMKLSDVVNLIRGDRDTVVRLQILPADGEKDERRIYNITRDKIKLTDSAARGEIIEEGAKSDGTPYKIGVINLPSFYMDMDAARAGVRDFKSCTRDVSRLLEGFNEKKVDAVVLDLRHNTGGALREAVNLTGLFLDQGPIVQVKNSRGQVTPDHDRFPGAVWDGPLVVLVSKFSASASEILAGAIQDYERGLIVGDHSTHGKGTVQSLMDLGRQLYSAPGKMGALKITINQFYRPSGDSTQKRGVVSDIELPALTTYLDIGEADLDYPLEFDRVDPMKFKKLDLVDKGLCERLGQLSSQRRLESDDFKKVLERIAMYKELKKKKVTTLNEEKFMAERAKLNVDKEEEKTFEEMNKPDRPVVDRNYYFDEALAITLDYLSAMGTN